MVLFGDKSLFTPSQQKLADFVERNPEEVLFLTEQEIADRIGVSIATVSRFWRAVGYDNIKAFKAKLRGAADATPSLKLETTIAGLDPASLPARMLEQTSAHLELTARELRPEELEETARFMAAARRIYVHAPGPSRALGELLSFRLGRFGLTVQLMAGSGHDLLESLAQLQSDDAVLLFCFTRMLPETEVILDCIGRTGCPGAMLTDREELRYGHPVRNSFWVSRGELGEFHSMTAPLLLIEQLILSIGLLQKEAVLKRLDVLSELRSRYANKLPRGR